MTTKKHTNRLIHCSSPYLLQHAHNPVNWNPWGEEALRFSREQDKPILLSIGYSACHWCHVMEHESFENEEIAALMNEYFVNIKVDREERPELDAIYMNFVQMTTGSGGWPLTVFLTPDLTPFYGGTYFPPRDLQGRPGFERILQNIADLYRSRRRDIDKNRDEIVQRLQSSTQWIGEEVSLSEELLKRAYSQLRQQFDNRYGGFGSSPKFPSAMALSFLLRYYKRTGQKPALDMVTLSLDEMSRGGIFDQLGGGFHRYSVDDRWLVPHFEKMLYDNALLCRVYLEAYQVTGSPHYREVVENTLTYVQREMLAPDGGFYSSQDADTEGYEGRFYIWGKQEVVDILGIEDAKIFNDFFDVTTEGNFEGKNILNHRRELEAFSRSLGLSVTELKKRLDGFRNRVYRARKKRVRPAIDSKVLAAWNGMMLTAFAEAAFVLKHTPFLETALRNATFLFSKMVTKGKVWRSWKDGGALLNGYLEDYSLIIEGWLATFQASGEICWLRRAEELMRSQLELFWDEKASSFYFTSVDHERLLIRHREFMDNASPSGNSVSCLNLLRLSILLGKPDYRDRAKQMLSRMGDTLVSYPLAFGYWLQALDFLIGPTMEIAVVGEDPEREKLLNPLRQEFLPNKVLIVTDMVKPKLGMEIPLLEHKTTVDSQPAVYFCQNYTCREPLTKTSEVERFLRATDPDICVQ